MEIKDNVFIVSGGSRGFGKVIVDTLVAEGAFVIILDIDSSSFNEIKGNQKIFPIQCDITDEEQISSAFNKIKLKFPRIHGLINNAGIIHNELLLNMMRENRRHNIDSWKKVIDINLSAPFLLTSYAVENMLEKRIKGVVINISSVSAKGNIGQTAYSAAKAGLEAMTKVWSKELGIYGIRCVAIAPGFFDTLSTRNALRPENILTLKEKIPLKRFGVVEELANTVIFAIKENYINGTVISIDGGLSL
jgi:3-oxoacyl-[acyl-carrier protein] reductase